MVKVYDAETGGEKFSFLAYDSSFKGGVEVAMSDFNRDTIPDIVTAPKWGGGPHIRVFDGVTGKAFEGALGGFMAYEQSFIGGVYVGVGDVNGDGRVDILTGAGLGGGPHVKAFSGVDGKELVSFYAYNSLFFGGVRVAGGDFNADGKAEIVTAPAEGGGSHIRVFDATTQKTIADPIGNFMAFGNGFFGGATVATGDTDADGELDLITVQYDNRGIIYDPSLMLFLQGDPLGFIGGDLNLSRYEGNNPAVMLDPIGFQSKKFDNGGPDVTDWFHEEIRLMRAHIEFLKQNPPDQIDKPFEALVWKYMLLRDIGNRLTDYKNRYDRPIPDNKAMKWPYSTGFDGNKAGNFAPETVTFHGQVISLNQLGNMMYGIAAAGLGLQENARAYGQGRFKIPPQLRDAIESQTDRKLPLFGPTDAWLEPGKGPYRAAAFELGVKYAEKVPWNGKNLDLMNGYVRRGFRAPYIQDGKLYEGTDIRAWINDDIKELMLKPCPATYTGPQTDILKQQGLRDRQRWKHHQAITTLIVTGGMCVCRSASSFSLVVLGVIKRIKHPIHVGMNVNCSHRFAQRYRRAKTTLSCINLLITLVMFGLN